MTKLVTPTQIATPTTPINLRPQEFDIRRRSNRLVVKSAPRSFEQRLRAHNSNHQAFRRRRKRHVPRNAPTASSIFIDSIDADRDYQARFAGQCNPMITALIGVTKAQPAVIATRPAREPFKMKLTFQVLVTK